MTLRPVPVTRGSGATYWKAAAEGRLVLPHCNLCDRTFWHPRPRCPHCGSSAVEWRSASGKGVIHTFTVVRQTTDSHFRNCAPYVVAMIDLDEGVRMMSNVIDCDPASVTIGMRVRCTYERLNNDVAVPLFAPDGNVG